MTSREIERVLIAGGTHGNEWIGSWLVKRWLKDPEPVRRRGFETLMLLANPEAVARHVRYVDQDLNRSFCPASSETPGALEARRAQEILRRFGPEGVTPASAVLDLHTTTANMGLSYIITNREPFNLRMAAWVRRHEPRLRVYLWIDETLPDSALSGIVPRGVTIEVGPTPNNVIRADLLIGTERVVKLCLDYLQDAALGVADPMSGENLEVFEHVRSYDYPRDASGQLLAVVHPDLQDRDYQPLHPGDPTFLMLDGETLRYAEQEVVYPVFINEAAYYEKGLAFSVARRRTLSL